MFIADNSSSLYELPPAPPAGVFDLRYASGRFVENVSAGTEIAMSSVTFPVTISAEGTDLVISDPAGGDILNVSFKDGESTQITDSRFSRLVIASTDIPDEFALDQELSQPI